MQQYWLNHNTESHNSHLVIFVLGWACDHRCVEHIKIDNSFDVLATYDYRKLEPLDKALLDSYDSIIVFAWSFGVWVAEQLFRDTPLSKAIAFCGTPLPIHKEFGIDPKRLAITIKGLSRNGCDTFLQRTYGNAYDSMKDIIQPRTSEENIEELTELYHASAKPYAPSIEWTKAVAGRDDVIFPPENIENYWGIRSQVLPLPHYPFYDAQIILQEIENR